MSVYCLITLHTDSKQRVYNTEIMAELISVSGVLFDLEQHWPVLYCECLSICGLVALICITVDVCVDDVFVRCARYFCQVCMMCLILMLFTFLASVTTDITAHMIDCYLVM